ncbi:MAG: 4Fe-4S dicluster-binding protein [Thermodesulfobacteriota bacterium]
MASRYLELARRIGLGQSERAPKLFKMLADPAEADILLTLPGQAPAVAAKLGRPEEEVARSLRELFLKGLVFPSSKTSPPSYRLCRDFVQFHDATILWPEAPREFLDLWQELMEVEWPEMARTYNQLLPRPFTRIIPVGVTVPARSQILAYEDIKEIVSRAWKLAVTNCTCRLTAHKCDKPLQVCLQINNAAAYSLNRGTGRELTKEETLDLMKKCEEAGLIHVVINKRDVDHFICNCCACCCQTMPILIEHGIKVIEPSRFAAEVDPDRCTACETCLTRCFFKAIAIEDESARVAAEKCLGCGLCQVTCPSEAITMKEVRSSDFVPEKIF